MKFPNVKATSLTKEEYLLPNDLRGDYNLVIVAFRQWHQDLVDTWIPSLQNLAQQHPGLEVYELPTMSRFNGLYRFIIDNGMRAGIPDRSVRASTLCAYIDLDKFQQALGLPTLDTIHLYLIDRSGEILWRGQGGYEAQPLAELAGVVDRLTAAAASAAPAARS
jgi:hypothetical protein